VTDEQFNRLLKEIRGIAYAVCGLLILYLITATGRNISDAIRHPTAGIEHELNMLRSEVRSLHEQFQRVPPAPIPPPIVVPWKDKDK